MSHLVPVAVPPADVVGRMWKRWNCQGQRVDSRVGYSDAYYICKDLQLQRIAAEMVRSGRVGTFSNGSGCRLGTPYWTVIASRFVPSTGPTLIP